MLAAAAYGLFNIVKESIQKKANVNYQDKDIVSYYLIIINDCLLVIDSFVVINLMITSLWIQYNIFIINHIMLSVSEVNILIVIKILWSYTDMMS